MSVRLDLLKQAVLDSSGINDRQELVLNFIRENKTARMSDLHGHFSKIPRITLSGDLSHLVREGLIQRKGRGRGTWYEF